MVHYCCAYGCKEKFVKNGPYTFHHFPKDENRRKQWEIQVRRKNFKATDSTKICSKHFKDECFNRTKFGATWLNDDAVPTIFNFPEHLIKKESFLPKSSLEAKDTSNSGEGSPEKLKRYSYLGDFHEHDMTSPTKAAKVLKIAQENDQKKRLQIKSLQEKIIRLKRKVTNLKKMRASSNRENESMTTKRQRISNNTEGDSDSDEISVGREVNDYSSGSSTPFFATEEEQDIQNPLTLKRLQAIPCGNYTAEKCFKWFMHPTVSNDFFGETFEKKPLFIKRDNPNYYRGLFSGKDFHKIMRENVVEYTKHIDVVSYANGERVTLNPEGRAYAPVVWDYYQQGCSIRMRNPQAYHSNLWQLCSLLQEYFGSFVGVNMYLTPPGSQGFAPHFDDIEAFVLQLEGTKHWRLYHPRSEKETLPSYSSGNFTQDEIGIPIHEFEVNTGDLLYFPRGFIHQAKTPEDTHSLHLTISTYQKNTWGHLLELALPSALTRAIENELELRESLPKDYLNFVGEVNSDLDCPERQEFIKKLTSLAQRVIKYLPVDESVDQHSKDFIHSSMPPFLTSKEKECSIHGGGEFWEDGQVKSIVELQPESKVRFIRKRIVRMVVEENCARIYHSIENSKDYKEWEMKYVECDLDAIPAFQLLLRAHPKFIPIEELPLDTLEDKMNFANDLYANGFLMTEEPLESIDD